MMMNKKIRNIIIFLVIAVLGIVYSVFYILYPEATKKVSLDVLEFVCTKPLPVIGITVFTLAILAFRIISATGIGRKILNECKKELAEAKKERVETKAELSAFEQRFSDKSQDFVEKHENNMRQICSAIPNRNVRELGEKLYGKREETIDSETKAD